MSTLLEVLAPIAEAEVAYHEAADAAMYGPGLDWDEDEPEFPEEEKMGRCSRSAGARWWTRSGQR